MADLSPLGTEIIGKLPNGRPIIKNPDGSVSTERTTTLKIDGKIVNIPTIFGGKAVSDEQAAKIIKEVGFIDPNTGQPINVFSSFEEAEQAARKRSESLGLQVDKVFEEQRARLLFPSMGQ